MSNVYKYNENFFFRKEESVCYFIGLLIDILYFVIVVLRVCFIYDNNDVYNESKFCFNG